LQLVALVAHAAVVGGTPPVPLAMHGFTLPSATMAAVSAQAAAIRYGTAQGRWVIVAAVLGSGVVFLDGTVVNVALPAISGDLHASVRGLQWMLDGYLVT